MLLMLLALMEIFSLNSLKYFIEENKQTTSAYISPSLKDIERDFGWGPAIFHIKI